MGDKWRILSVDPWLEPYEGGIAYRMGRYQAVKEALTGPGGKLKDFANGHLYYGVRREADGWVVREYLPSAERVCLIGDFNGWNRDSHPMTPIGGGDWEIRLPGKEALRPGQRLLLSVAAFGGIFDRIPAYARGVARNEESLQFMGLVTEDDFVWHDEKQPQRTDAAPVIYECHIGMAQEKEGIGSYDEFIENVLPRVKEDGYNTIQLMAVQGHAYYASFGYQVTNPFAPAAWYGEPTGLKRLIDRAHGMGLRVLLDLVHSHASDNERDGVANFDGSGRLYCEGTHPAWGSRLYNYARHDVIHYLLSNIKYWMEEFHFDGFRFDGVTSMLYHDHGLGKAFVSYDDYYSLNADTDAQVYLMLAAELIHEIRPEALAIAEDMSGMPGMCLPIEWGGFGFDYRLNMGVPDLWIKLIKEYRDEDWDMFTLWHELTTRRPQEKTVGYAESHDQALVGDKTIIFRLLDAEMYTGMHQDYHTPSMERGVALSKLIKFVTLAAAGEGYLNFMGNEFGHPEWIDFPREGNGWSYYYARRQWHLADDGELKYRLLGRFDRDMLALIQRHGVLGGGGARSLWIDQENKALLFERGGVVFLFNFGGNSMPGYPLRNMPQGKWRVALDSDRLEYGGWNRVDPNVIYETDENGTLLIYAPERTAIALERA